MYFKIQKEYKIFENKRLFRILIAFAGEMVYRPTTIAFWRNITVLGIKRAKKAIGAVDEMISI